MENVENGKRENRREIDATERRNDSSEESQVRVAQRGQRVHELTGRIREPSQDEAADEQGVVNVQRAVDTTRDDAFHRAVTRNHRREKLPPKPGVAAKNVVVASVDASRRSTPQPDDTVPTTASETGLSLTRLTQRFTHSTHCARRTLPGALAQLTERASNFIQRRDLSQKSRSRESASRHRVQHVYLSVGVFSSPSTISRAFARVRVVVSRAREHSVDDDASDVTRVGPTDEELGTTATTTTIPKPSNGSMGVEHTVYAYKCNFRKFVGKHTHRPVVGPDNDA